MSLEVDSNGRVGGESEAQTAGRFPTSLCELQGDCGCADHAAAATHGSSTNAIPCDTGSSTHMLGKDSEGELGKKTGSGEVETATGTAAMPVHAHSNLKEVRSNRRLGFDIYSQFSLSADLGLKVG